MMTLQQYLLMKLAEECAEVAQRALKAAQFGLDEVQKGQDLNNAERIYGELNDLHSITILLNDTIPGFDYTPDMKAMKAKRNKLKKYKKLSEAQGQVVEDDKL